MYEKIVEEQTQREKQSAEKPSTCNTGSASAGAGAAVVAVLVLMYFSSLRSLLHSNHLLTPAPAARHARLRVDDFRPLRYAAHGVGRQRTANSISEQPRRHSCEGLTQRNRT